MTKLFLVFSFSITLTSFNMWSQTNQFDIKANSGFLFFNADTPIKNAEGTMYFEEKFLPCKIDCFKGETPLIRYNAYKDEMEFERNENLFYLAKNDTCMLDFNSKKFRFCYYRESGYETNGYLEILIEEPSLKYNLYKSERILFVEAQPAVNSYKEDKPAHFTPDKIKYFIKTTSGIVELPRKKKEVISFFVEKSDAIEKYLKENKNTLNSDKDMISFINFVNTL